MKKLILIITILTLTGCYEETNKRNYEDIKIKCKNGNIRTDFVNGFGLTKYLCCDDDKIQKCIDSFSFKANGEFEDWDTEDIPKIISECQDIFCYN